jgi:hypothetical protein
MPCSSLSRVGRFGIAWSGGFRYRLRIYALRSRRSRPLAQSLRALAHLQRRSGGLHSFHPAVAHSAAGFTVCKSAVSLVRKPDARKSHIRCDERDLETEKMVRYSDTDKPKGSETVTAEPNSTAPDLDSTRHPKRFEDDFLARRGILKALGALPMKKTVTSTGCGCAVDAVNQP